MSNELWKWSATDLSRGIRSREFTGREVTTACLERLDTVNSQVNAVVEFRAEEALAAADQADDKMHRGEPIGLLHSVPLTTKVNVDQAGSASTNGVVTFKELIASSSNPSKRFFVNRLRHVPTVCGVTRNCSAISPLERSSRQLNTMRARIASACEV